MLAKNVCVEGRRVKSSWINKVVAIKERAGTEKRKKKNFNFDKSSLTVPTPGNTIF